MKKVLSFILILTLTISCVSMVSFTVSAATYGQLTYTVSNGKVTITGCDTSASGALTIPSTISGYPVTSIGNSAFEDCTSLTGITIPDGVTRIGYSAFQGCSNLTNITIPNSVTSICDYAFYDCSSLTGITIPDSVTSIGGSAFYGCSKLSSITIPDSVTSIGGYAFRNCSKLTSITIPDSVTSIGSSPFYNAAYYNDSNNWENDVLYINNHLIEAKYKISGEYVIKEGTKTIADYAFDDCYSLTSITIPASVTSIGYWAFYNCKSLTSITIPDGVTSIGGSAFYNCSSLISITIPDSVTSIGRSTFEYCKSLTSITIPDSVTSIGDRAFYYCDSLTSITIPDSVTSISDYAFYYCSGLTDITIPDSVTNIGYSVFYNCDSLTSITIPDSVTSIGDYAFYYCSGLTSITIPDSVTSIGDWAFLNCDSLTTVYYRGTQAQWDSISIGSSNSSLTSATRYYNSCIQSTTHTYDNICDTECNICNDIRSITHTYDNACDAECNVCNDIREVPDHIYDNACDTICNVCNDIRDVPDHSYTLNNNHTCDICKFSKTPEKPIVESKISNSITLVKTEGFEYSKDGITWQNSNVFTNLSPDTTYTFYQRVKASSVASVSEASEGTTVYLKASQTAPSAVPIVLSFTDTMVTLRAITNGEYSVDGINWQKSNVFENLSPATTYTIYQRYAETDTHEASATSQGTSITTEKYKQTLIPDAPTLTGFTSRSIALTAVDGCEYSMDGKTWQASNVFNYLSCGTEYTFYQRYKENTTYYAGNASQSATFKTDKGSQTAPSAPTLLSKTHDTVTLNPVSGYEYSKDTVSWQTSNVFTNLDPETNYFFYQRKTETDRYYASEISTSLIVKTEEAPEIIYGDVNSDTFVNKKDDLAMRKYLADPTYEIDLEAANVFYDNAINKKDLLRLKQHLADPEITLGK